MPARSSSARRRPRSIRPASLGDARDRCAPPARAGRLEDEDPRPIDPTSARSAVGLPVRLRSHLLAGGDDPEHRVATVAFVHFDGVDELAERAGPARSPTRWTSCSSTPRPRPRSTTSRFSAPTSIATAARSSSSPECRGGRPGRRAHAPGLAPHRRTRTRAARPHRREPRPCVRRARSVRAIAAPTP